MKFQSGHSGGRPKGARNRLTVRVFEDILAHWNEPATDGSMNTKGRTALEIMLREKPNEYVRAVLSVMPREIAIENVMADIDNQQLDEMMAKIREHLLTGRKADADDNVIH
jgi:hypothetical protein